MTRVRCTLLPKKQLIKRKENDQKNQHPEMTKSIAVLPFVNMSADPDNEYFSDGITEEIINALTKIEGLKVIARTSSFSFKGKNIDVRIIGNELGVITVLEGSVRKAQNRVRITAQLIKTDDGSHLWSKNFDRELEDIFAIQDEISLLIADQIRENFGHLEIKESLVGIPDISIDTYQLYLKGRYYVNKFNPDSIKEGIAILQQVLEQKSNFALAHVSIHYGYNIMAAAGLMPVKEALTIGKQHLDRALELDDKLPECYHSLGWHSLNNDWDFTSATKYLMKAIELRPGYADAHQKLFINLALEGKLDTAFEHINVARQLDPLAAINNYFTAYYFYLKDDFEKANLFFDKTFEIESTFIVGYSIYALALTRQKRPDAILAKANGIPDMDGAEVERLIMRTIAHCQINNQEETGPELKKLRAGLDGPYRERIRFFLIYIETILGEYDRAFDLIEAGIKYQEPLMTLLKVDPLLKERLPKDRFQKALKIIYRLSDHNAPFKKNESISKLSASEVPEVLSQLDQEINLEKIFLDPSLSLRQLAEKIDLHPNKLSWLLNEHIGKNFNEYINSFRLATFKEKSLDPKNSHLTLLGLAYESGFNSKTVFNSFFKKMEGVTPSAWVKSKK